jgi:hypothetical protein
MSSLRIFAVAASLATLLGAAGCQQQETPVEPDPVVYPLITENFTGTVEVGGTKAFSFTVTNPGNVNVSITSLSPVSTLTMGLGLGGWTAATETCTEALPATGGARLNVVLTGTPQAAGQYCVAIYDIGNVPTGPPTEFALTLTHY